MKAVSKGQISCHFERSEKSDIQLGRELDFSRMVEMTERHTFERASQYNKTM